MAKNDKDLAESMTLNRIKPQTNLLFNVIFWVLAAVCIIPVIFVFMISISSEESIRANGYQFTPEIGRAHV